MKREDALNLLHTHMQNANLRRHCYAVEVVMKTLAKHFHEDEEVWGVVGLLHDGDYEEVKKDPTAHTLLMHKWLTEAGEKDSRILNAILSHNFAPQNNLEWSLYCCDELTGLIVACALVKPDKKLSSVTVDSVLNKWDKKQFAAGVKREQIASCEEKLGIKLNDFIGKSLSAMQSISNDLGL